MTKASTVRGRRTENFGQPRGEVMGGQFGCRRDVLCPSPHRVVVLGVADRDQGAGDVADVRPTVRGVGIAHDGRFPMQGAGRQTCERRPVY
jgi:hypothetical protein